MNGNPAERERQPPEIRNAMASGWMKRGITLLAENTTASLTDSLRWFEGAIELRRALPLHENPWYRFVLAAGWMNRADALTRLGSAKNLAEAVHSYNEALALLQTLELESTPLFRKRLALAWMNRGVTLQKQGTPESLRQALGSFDRAVAIWRAPLALEDADNRRILATALMNWANALLSLNPRDAALACESAGEAVALTAGDEEQELATAEIGLEARHLLCRAVANRLAEETSATAVRDLVAAATDAVDDGMRLARLWETQAEGRLRDLASELFRFGARISQMYQPHFLTEFLLENLDPFHSHDALPVNPRLHRTADEAIARAMDEIQRDGFRSLNTPRFDQFLGTLRQLRITQTRLDELRRAAVRECACLDGAEAENVDTFPHPLSEN